MRTPKTLRQERTLEELYEFGADLFVVVAYGRILPTEALQLPRLGAVNVHPSLLPEYRGPSPVQTAILDGAARTGVTIMALDAGMDTGPILRQSDRVPLLGTERTGALMDRLFSMGAAMLPGVLDDMDSGRLTPVPQDDSRASVTSQVRRSDGEADWSSPAELLERMIRAYDPWPGVFTRWKGRRLKILDAAVEGPASAGPPGKTLLDAGRLFVATGRGALELRRVQMEGRRPMSAIDLPRGHPDFTGSVLPS